jgi:hypothetical protein
VAQRRGKERRIERVGKRRKPVAQEIIGGSKEIIYTAAEVTKTRGEMEKGTRKKEK